MVKIRLTRVGKKKQAVFRVVVTDSRSPRDGRFIEIIGQYNPRSEPSDIQIDEEKALNWLAKGAQASEQVTALMKRVGIWQKHVEEKKAGKLPERAASA